MDQIKIKKFSISAKLLCWLLVVILFSFVYLSQVSYDTARIGKKNSRTQPFVLSPEAMSYVSLGFNSFLSDITWIQTIQYFGNWAPTDDGYIRLPKMLETITKLEPKFEYPYVFSCLILPGEGFTNEAIEIGKRGTEELKDSWQIPYYLGFVYHGQKDYANAAKYFSIAAERPDTLPIVKVLAGIYYAKADQRDVAISIWKGIYESTKNDFVKERAKAWLDHYDYIVGIEQLSQIYKDKYGSYPTSLQEMYDKKILPELPQDNLNKSIELNPENGKVINK